MNIIQTKTFHLATHSRGSSKSGKLALILPGKLDTKDYPHMRAHVDFLSKRGYLAVSFDPPGTWESSGDISLYTMENYLLAIDELIEHFGNKPTFIVGHSRGGSVAMLAGTTNRYVTHFAAIMSYYTFDPSIHGGYPDEEWQKAGYRLSTRDNPNGAGLTTFRLPYEFLESEIKYDMRQPLAESSKPKMFVLGEQDKIVKPEIVERAFEISEDSKYLYRLDYEHDYRKDQTMIQRVNEYIDDFLRHI